MHAYLVHCISKDFSQIPHIMVQHVGTSVRMLTNISSSTRNIAIILFAVPCRSATLSLTYIQFPWTIWTYPLSQFALCMLRIKNICMPFTFTQSEMLYGHGKTTYPQGRSPSNAEKLLISCDSCTGLQS